MHEPGFERDTSDTLGGGEGEDEEGEEGEGEGEGEFTIVTGKEGQNSKKKEALDTLDG